MPPKLETPRPLYDQPLLDLNEKLIIDLFAGGGGASSGIEEALGRPVDIAINHDAAAVAMHEANHPQTLHLISDVFEIDPREVCQGRPVGFLWASPDCTHHSKARGGKPIRTRKRRALAWVVTRWAGQVRPDIIMLENVEEFADWGPLIGPPGELRPCPKRKGQTFKAWVKSLRDLGYVVEWRELRACDYGAPTIRKRLFLVARCDGNPIVWPEPTHAAPDKAGNIPDGMLAYRTAGECIDWTIPMCSIFATKDEAKAWALEHKVASPIRPLADNTHKRIARGVMRFVINNPRPYLVSITHAGGDRIRDIDWPFTTITTAHRGEVAVVSPVVAGVGGRAGQSPERGGDQPFHTVTGKADSVLVAPALFPRYGERKGQKPRTRSVELPAPVIVPGANGASLVGANFQLYHSSKEGGDERVSELGDPVATLDTQNRVGLCATFLGQNNGGGNDMDGREVGDPLSTILSKSTGHHPLFGLALTKSRGTGIDADPADPLHTVSAGGLHHGLVVGDLVTNTGPQQGVASTHLVAVHADHNNTGHTPSYPIDSPAHTVIADGAHHNVVATHIQRDFGNSVGGDSGEPIGTITADRNGHAALVGSFLSKYYGEGLGSKLDDPSHTIPTVDRFGLVTVTIGVTQFYIRDICMRMLSPRELYLCQGFRPTYIIDRGVNGKPLTKSEQVHMCGNSVSPPVSRAMVKANANHLVVRTVELPKVSKARVCRTQQAVA